MRITPLPQAGFASTPWRNGRGVTVDIDAERSGRVAGDDWAGLRWRFGRTSIIEPGPFSDLSGYERLQMVIVGRGLVLDHERGSIDLRRPFTTARYDGGLPIDSRLENGPVEVLNLIGDRELVRLDLTAVADDRRIELPEGIHVLYVPEEPVEALLDGSPHHIASCDALRIDADTPFAMAGKGGRLVVASVLKR